MKTELHPDDARFEKAIETMLREIRSTNWAWLANDKDAGDNSPWVLMPLAYAMFQHLFEDVADNPESWGDFLHDALEETIMRFSEPALSKYRAKLQAPLTPPQP